MVSKRIMDHGVSLDVADRIDAKRVFYLYGFYKTTFAITSFFFVLMASRE